MPLTLTLETRLIQGDRVIRGQESFTAGSLVSMDEPFTGTMSIVQGIDVSALKAIFITTDQDVTIEFNTDGESPVAINIYAGQAWSWHSTSGLANPFGADDVNSIYFYSSSPEEVRVQMEILTDPTP